MDLGLDKVEKALKIKNIYAPENIRLTHYLEESLKADFSLIKAWRADKMGNLIYRNTAMNFNPMMATAGEITVAEVEEIVEVGMLDPNHIHTAGIYVDRVIQGCFEKRIEQKTCRRS